MNRKWLFVGAAAVLLSAFVIGTLIYQSEKMQQSARNADGNRANVAQFHSPALGNPEAKVHIVEFLDPACETCATMYPYVKQIMAAYPDRVRLSIRHLQFHDGSDYVVKVLEASRKQGKYWQTLEALLASQSYWARNHRVEPALIWKPLEAVGLNVEQIKVDMNAPEIAQRIAQDVQDARALNVTKTPEYFVNGRPLPSFGLEQLQRQVSDAVGSAYR
jgi:protein-disulfide isomerase